MPRASPVRQFFQGKKSHSARPKGLDNNTAYCTTYVFPYAFSRQAGRQTGRHAGKQSVFGRETERERRQKRAVRQDSGGLAGIPGLRCKALTCPEPWPEPSEHTNCTNSFSESWPWWWW